MKNMIPVLLFAVGVSGCLDNSDSIQNAQQEELSMRSVEAVGLPGITKFSEKRTLKQILELRDREVSTYTYTQDMNGRLHLLCSSIGYGIPYSTQFTNPGRAFASGAVLPQADPNGLFSPASAEGTWVLCLNTETKKTSPVLVEQRLIVSPFNMGRGGNL